MQETAHLLLFALSSHSVSSKSVGGNQMHSTVHCPNELTQQLIYKRLITDL